MNLVAIPPSKKIALIILALLSITLTALLAYALVYAPADSLFKKDVLIIGLSFLGVLRHTIWYFKKILRKYNYRRLSGISV